MLLPVQAAPTLLNLSKGTDLFSQKVFFFSVSYMSTTNVARLEEVSVSQKIL